MAMGFWDTRRSTYHVNTDQSHHLITFWGRECVFFGHPETDGAPERWWPEESDNMTTGP